MLNRLPNCTLKTIGILFTENWTEVSSVECRAACANLSLEPMSYMSGGTEHFLCSGYWPSGYRSGYNIAGAAGCYIYDKISATYSCLCDSGSLEWISASKCPQNRSQHPFLTLPSDNLGAKCCFTYSHSPNVGHHF